MGIRFRFLARQFDLQHAMLEILIDEVRDLWRVWRPHFAAGRQRLKVAAIAMWSVVRSPILLVLQVIAALIVLFEEWGWRPLVAALGQLARFRVWARMELWIASLPPYGALAVFALPTTLLLPLKFVAAWLLANGQVMAAGGLFLAAKVASTALIARVFLLTKPALMQIEWFARAYNWFMPWKEAIFAEIRGSWAWRYGRMVKSRVKLGIKHTWARWVPWWRERLVPLRVRLREGWRRTKAWFGFGARRVR